MNRGHRPFLIKPGCWVDRGRICRAGIEENRGDNERSVMPS